MSILKTTLFLAIVLLPHNASAYIYYSLGMGGAEGTSFGAVCDGTTDDTAAFEAALAAVVTGTVYVPTSIHGCAVCDLVIPIGKKLQGSAPQLYSGVPQTAASRLVPTAACTTNIISEVSYASIEGVDVYAGGFGETPNYGKSVACIAGGQTRPTLLNNNFRFCGAGALSGTTYNNTVKSYGNIYYGNGQADGVYAWSNTVDSESTDDTLTANYGGYYFGSGANSNRINSPRIEWNQHFGVYCNGASYLNFSNVQYDRNYDADIKLTGCSRVTDIGGSKKRGGRTNTAGANASIVSGGGNTGILFAHTTYRKGTDDGGGGTESPAYVFYQHLDTDTDFYITDSDTRSGFVTGFARYAGSGNGVVIKDNSGVEDKP